ncbi:MAG: aldo/keto reductase [bacterium]
MKYRTLGNTGISVSEIGFGAGGKFGMADKITDGKSADLVKLAIELGINFFDTASSYGFGLSEKRLGMALKGNRDKVYIATKCFSMTVGEGKEAEVIQDYTAKGITRSVEDSLRRLQTDYLDIIQLHSPPWKIIEQTDEPIRAIEDIKKSGKARFIGISKDGEKAVDALNMNVFDTLQIGYNVMNQSAMAEALPLAADKGVGIIIKTPAAQSVFLREAAKPPEDWMEKTWNKRNHYDFLNDYDMHGTEIALRFVLDSELVHTVIQATTSSGHLRNNIKASDGEKLDNAIINKITHAWRQTESA